MVDRPRPTDPKWLKQVERNFGEYQLVEMTATGERGIVCQMQIEPESQIYLQRYPTEKTEALTNALEPLLNNPPKPKLILTWGHDKHIWKSKIKDCIIC